MLLLKAPVPLGPIVLEQVPDGTHLKHYGIRPETQGDAIRAERNIIVRDPIQPTHLTRKSIYMCLEEVIRITIRKGSR